MIAAEPTPRDSLSSHTTESGNDRNCLPNSPLPAAEIAGARWWNGCPSEGVRGERVGTVGIIATVEQDRRANVERRACWEVTGCGKEPGGTRVAESGPCVIATGPVTKRPRLPYPLCPAMESGNGNSLRKMVRQLIEGAL